MSIYRKRSGAPAIPDAAATKCEAQATHNATSKVCKIGLSADITYSSVSEGVSKGA